MAPNFKQVLSPSSRGGNRRLLAIVGGVVALLIATIAISSIHHKEIPQSVAGKTPTVNPMPGGLNSNPNQDALRQQDMRDQAQHAQQVGQSYTPDLAPGVSTHPPPSDAMLEPDRPHEVGLDGDPMAKRAAPATPTTPPHPAPTVVPSQAVIPVVTQPALAATPVDPQQQKAETALYDRALRDLEGRIEGRPPVTDVLYTTEDLQKANDARQKAASANTASAASQHSAVSAQTILIPAGRGVYAHTVSAINSDLGGNIILEADSGPIAGDRMIATVSRAGGHLNRLIVRVDKIMHHGEVIQTQGTVVAPDTMEAAVASSVDQLYVQRFVLPAAAAFVQGLGQAIETTSNTVGSVGALGNVNYVQSLSLPQQLGVAAGAAANQLNTAMLQQMPNQPRINLAANVNVGVLFLSNVATSH